MPLYFQLGILTASVAGLGIVGYIREHKKSQAKKPMICFLKADCHAVVTSRYSSFLSLAWEQWGFVYYGMTFAVYLSTIVSLPLLAHPLVFAWGLASGLAFCASLYLTYIQAAKLKQWCTWCLCSAALSTLIFASVLVLRFSSV